MGQLSLKEAVAMALGGMIGGGIYSAFGIVVAISGDASWLAWLVAGIVAMCAGYSYVKLNTFVDAKGGAPTYIEELVGNSTLAGMTGWTLLFGYVGSMALYAYAFSSFFSELLGRLHFYGIPVANAVSILLIGAFVALNLVGAAETGQAEDVLTFIKVVVIGVFGIWGVYHAFTVQKLTFGLSSMSIRDPILGAAMSFVAFQGWQLLMYDQDKFDNPKTDIKKAIYISIPAATVLYILVALTTVSLLKISVIAVSPEVSLLYAGLQFMGIIGALIIGISALFSTASAVNATLFSSALFSQNLIDRGLLPEKIGGSSDGEIPKRIVVVLGALSAGFAVVGSLKSITSFASLAFIAVFGGMSYLALKQRDQLDLITPIPVVGLLGTAAFFPLLLYDLYLNSPEMFVTVLLIGAAVIGVELLYFEREPIEDVLPWMSGE
ncbi:MULTISPECIES: APC family permease [unclassified Haladaptatus]|uniref:APC family permease n=1 Tax=unclassified Haladaptatus TaxID=2622732 RepID=UPI0023E79BA4|nr:MULTISPECIES: APC family permease [unclassified Haladaptatus]